MPKGNNPWPENSDYGKHWRLGYNAGRYDALKRLLPAFERMIHRASTSDEGGEK